MSGEQVEMVSEAAEMVEFAIRGFAFVSSFLGGFLKRVQPVLRRTLISRLSGESFEGCDLREDDEN
jgi:hypothetical protein